MDLPEIETKLKALRNLVATYIDPVKQWSIKRDLAVDLFDRYTKLSSELRAKGTLFDEIPSRKNPRPRDDNPELIPSTEIKELLKAIDYCLDLLASLEAVSIPSMKVTREGVFFAGQYFDALQRVSEIVSQAQQSIFIIDGYVDERVLNILTAKNPAVEIRLLTRQVSPALNTAAVTFNKQYGLQGKLSLRTSSAFHDRFIIIDGKDFYHFGASIKDLGNRGFMFSVIEEPDVINALGTKVTQEWNAATVVM